MSFFMLGSELILMWLFVEHLLGITDLGVGGKKAVNPADQASAYFSNNYR